MFIPLEWLIVGPVILSLLVGFYVVSIFRSFFRKRSYSRMRNEVRMRKYEDELLQKEEKIALQEKEIQSRVKAIQKVAYELNHYGGLPVVQRFEGLEDTNVKLWESIDQNIEQVKKPDHHRYGELLERDIKTLKETWKMAVVVAKSLKVEILKSVHKVNDLQ